MSDKNLSGLGIGFLLLTLIINPIAWGQLTSHYFVFSLVFVLLGICLCFQFVTPWRYLVNGFRFLEHHSGWPILLCQVGFFIIFLCVNSELLSYQKHAGWGDEPSYTGFDFSSWTSVLGNHRTLGLPLILKTYHLFFKDLTFWPHIQMIGYVGSIIFLYWALLKSGLNRLAALIIVSLLLWDRPNYLQLLNVQTESLTAIFLNLTIASMLLALRPGHWIFSVLLTIVVSFLYQIRPNFAFIPLLIPFWAMGFIGLQQGFAAKKIIPVGLRFAALTLIPLFLFCFLRLAIVGQFGVVSMSGGCLAGHAAHYLNENNIKSLSPDIQPLANEILVRKRQLTAPSNLSPFDWIKLVSHSKKIEMQAQAFGPDLINAWTVAIKQLKGVEPFEDPKKNIDPMEYNLPLSAFHAKYYNYETDKLLSKFSSQVLAIEWQRYYNWIVGGSFYGLKILFSDKALWFTCLGLLGLLKLWFLYFGPPLDQVRLQRWHRDVLLLFLFGSSICGLGFLPIIIFNFPFPRLLNVISLYLLPTLTCIVLPPIWLTTKNPGIKETDNGQDKKD